MDSTDDFDPSTLDIAALMNMLKLCQKVAPVMLTREVDISGIVIAEKHIPVAFALAKKQLQAEIPYNVENSYDCAWLRDQVLNKFRKNESKIILETRCCTLESCPQMRFMELFVENLRYPSSAPQETITVNTREEEETVDE